MEEEKYVSGEEFRALKTKKNSGNSGQYNKKVLLIVAAVAYSVIIFYLGITYQKNNTKSIAKTAASQFGGFAGRGGANFANRLFGTVTAISSSSISVNNTRTNSTTTVAINSNTQITSNQQTISASDITVGEDVMVALDPSNTSIATSITVVTPPTTSSTGSQTQL
jgi:hypothetical protein